MSASDPSETLPDDGVASTATVDESPESAAEAEPAPEPWTPERVLEWNRYYDLYVAASVVLRAGLAAVHKSIGSLIWTLLRSGRMIIARGPLVTDPFSYTMAGKRWINIPWLYEAASAALYDAAANFGGGADPDMQLQYGVGALTILNALLRAVAVVLLLRIRRPGPGLWWAAVCAGLALGGMLTPMPGAASPIVPTLGGIAEPAVLDPSAWGILLMAVELVLIHSALLKGRSGSLWALVPLFLLWANIDGSFLLGLFVLALYTVGAFLPSRRTAEDPESPGAPKWALVLLLSAAACLLNPSHIYAYSAAAHPWLALFSPDSGGLSFFGKSSHEFFDKLHGTPGAYRAYIGYYVAVVVLGLASFFLNRRNFSPLRFLVFVAMAAVWANNIGMSGFFALIWAVTIALNGHEWYLDHYGREGRLGFGWSAWSVGGRLITLLVVFAFIFKGLTGFTATASEPPFGLGVNGHAFAFDAADYLKTAPITGAVLNTTSSQGDALIWRAFPTRRPYVDSRPNVYPAEFRRKLNDLRLAIRDDKPEIWKPALDEYGITVVMLPMRLLDPIDTPALNTFLTLKASPNWIPFYDDGAVVMFGRADAKGDDLAFFQSHKLDADSVAFKRDEPVPSPSRTPTPTTALDEYFPSRSASSPEPHIWAAERWLSAWSDDPTAPPDLAQCLLAVRQARTALARNPDDTNAWRTLNRAYRTLTETEGRVLAKNATQDTAAPTDYLMFRLGQRIAVLNYAIQSTPPPRTDDAKDELGDLHRELASLFRSAGDIDLERRELQAAKELKRPGEFPEDEAQRLEALDRAIEELEGRLNDVSAEQQAGPLQRAQIALQAGAPGIAVAELEEAENSGISPPGVKPQLIDLYCRIGEPDKAFEQFGGGNVNDPALATGPGTGAYRQGLANLLIGAYDLAAALWRDRAIPELRMSETVQAMEAGRLLLQGSPKASTDAFQKLPAQLGNQAAWEYHLGLAALEGGMPTAAADHFEKALQLEPTIPVRPLLAYYLEKLGRKVPEAAGSAEAPAVKPAMPTGPDALGGGGLLEPKLPAPVPTVPETPKP